MQVELSFSPTMGRAGSSTPITVTAAYSSDVRSVDIFVYSMPGVTPTSEEGWFKLGSIAWSGGSVPWSVAAWDPGKYAVGAVARDNLGQVIGHWNPATEPLARRIPMVTFDIGRSETDGLGGGVTSPLEPGQTLPWTTLALAGAGILAFLVWRSRNG